MDSLSFSTDPFKKLNETNLQLQGDDLNLLKTKTIINAFVTKRLVVYKKNSGRTEFIRFPNLSMKPENDEDLIT